jgi:hypothetical protein
MPQLGNLLAAFTDTCKHALTGIYVCVLAGPPGAQLQGTTRRLPVKGVVVFDDLRLNTVGSNSTIKFCLGLIQRCEATLYGNPFVTVDTGSLAMIMQPGTAYAGRDLGLGTAPKVQVLDAQRRIMDAQVAIAVRLYDGFSGRESSVRIFGETVVTSRNGVADFKDMNVRSSGYYRLGFEVLGTDNLTVVSDVFRVLPSYESLTCERVGASVCL